MLCVQGTPPPCDEDAAALAERAAELMDSILVEEENLVAFHRAKLEEDMETMRREMLLLQEVDKPGSEVRRGRRQPAGSRPRACCAAPSSRSPPSTCLPPSRSTITWSR